MRSGYLKEWFTAQKKYGIEKNVWKPSETRLCSRALEGQEFLALCIDKNQICVSEGKACGLSQCLEERGFRLHICGRACHHSLVKAFGEGKGIAGDEVFSAVKVNRCLTDDIVK